MIFNLGGGGGSAGAGGFELTVVDGYTKPAKVSNNTIWVETGVEVTNVTLCAEDYTEGYPNEGTVWIVLEDSGTIKTTFPVGDNWITIYPVSAKQFIDGEWINVGAYLYQDYVWVQFSSVDTSVYIIKDGYVDFEQYPYTYTRQSWDSMTNSVKTTSGGVESNAIKVSQTYNDKPALWTNSSNGYYWKNKFSDVTVPRSASLFKFEYYLLGSEGKNPTVTVGEATASIDRGDAKKVENGIVEIDVTGLRGQTVEFTYTTHGGANNYNNYVANAWFE